MQVAERAQTDRGRTGRPGGARRSGDLAAALLLAALAGALVLPRLDEPYLWQDEAQTALVAKTILEGGLPRGSDGRNQFSQELGKEYAEGYLWRWHTWLSFYATAASFALLGPTTTAARLPFALFGIGSVVFTWFLGRRLWRRPEPALASAVLLALSVPFLIFSRQCRYYSMCAFFTIWGLHAYAGLGPGRRAAWLSLVVAASLLFHSHYVYAATLLAACALHAALLERPRLVPTLLAGAAVTALQLPWIVWFAGVRPGGDAYAATLLDLGRIVGFVGGYLALVFEWLFDPRLLLLLPVLFAWDLVAEGRRPGVSRETGSGVVLLLLTTGVTILGVSVLSPLLFYRYLAPLAPLLALLGGLLVGSLAQRSRLAGVAALALWLVPGSLPSYLDGLRHDFDGPIEGIVGFLRGHARPDDLVAISYGDLPVKFYTDLRVIGGLTGEPLTDLPRADWIVLRRHTNTHADRETQEQMRALLRAHPERYVRHVLPYPDTAFETREDPARHRFRTAHEQLPRVVIYERRR